MNLSKGFFELCAAMKYDYRVKDIPKAALLWALAIVITWIAVCSAIATTSPVAAMIFWLASCYGVKRALPER